MAKYLLPLIGGIATVALLTSQAFAHVSDKGKATAAVAIMLACIVVGALVSRGRKPKPQAAAPRPAPFSQYRQN
jgi:hypothetical protein